jgi:hypothetical protein
MMHARVKARPDAGYDVMRTADTWLATNLADTMLYCECRAGLEVDEKTPSHWYVTLRKIERDLASWGWRACINHYLPRQTN